MLSRVADSLYWIAQNMERADSVAKLLSARLVSILENQDPLLGTESDWKEVIEIASDKEEFRKIYDSYNRESVIQYLAFSKQNSNSILSCIKVARENAKMVREILPIELWEVINDLYLEIKEVSFFETNNEDLNRFLQSIHEKYFLFQGIISGFMSRREGYLFLVFGKYLEVIRKLARTLDVYYHKKRTERFEKEDIQYHYWSSVLSSLSGYHSYIQKYQASMDPVKIVNYLLFDDSQPRSASYGVQQLVNAFQVLEKQQINDYAQKLYGKLEELHQELRYDSVKNLPVSLHEYCQKLQSLCDSVGIAIMETYYLGEMSPT
ncbi:alpha-E domain-containing protein [Niallia sp. 03133]|uniref:alpha-E domain-containing protein n=1 Tax=Niallia sp. 03133 TaxID=3458060 RepID=UPI0040443992